MAALGLCYEDLAADLEFDIWPENEEVVRLFLSVNTQWRAGPGGIYGLDYNVIPFALKLSGIKKSKWPEIMSDLQIMEGSAIEQMRSR